MPALQRTINKARRRAVADLAVRGTGWGLALGAGAALCLLLVERAAGVPLWPGSYPLLAGAGVVLGVVRWVSRRPPEETVAVRLDRALHLKDRLGTAEAVTRGRVDGEFAELARRDGERVAETIDVAAATPIRMTRIWWPAAALAAALALGVPYLPSASRASARPQTAESLRRQGAQISETIDEALSEIGPDTLDPASRDELNTLQELARQLEQPGGEAELAEARDRSAARLDELADGIAEEARRNLEAVDEVTERFSEITTEDAPAEAEDFLEALRDGDLGAAAEQLEQLMRERDELTPPTRESVAQALRELGEGLDAAAEQEPDLANQQQELREALEDLGADEQDLDKLAEQLPDLERELRDRGVDEDTLRRLSRDVEELRRQEQVRREAETQQRDLAEALEDAARQLEEKDEENGGEKEDQREPEQHQQQTQPGTTPQQKPSSSPTPTPTPNGEQRRPQQQPGQTDNAQQPDAPPEQEPGTSPRTTPAPATEGEQPQSRQEPGTTDDAQQPDSPPSPRPSVSDVLRRLERMRREGTEQQQMSRELREAARELADTLTEQEKQQLVEQWMRRAGSPSGAPGTPPDDAPPTDRPPRYGGMEEVDLRGEPPDDEAEVIARWLSEDGPEGAPDAGARRARVRKARSQAEQAVEESVVPARYHELIQRYFGRLADTTRQAAGDEADGP